MTPSGIRFEWQEEYPCMVEGTRPGLTLPQGTPPADPCNKVNIKPYRASLAHGRLPWWLPNTTTLAHRCRRGASTPSRWRTDTTVGPDVSLYEGVGVFLAMVL